MKGYFSEETLDKYARLTAEKLDVDFAEGDLYDFTTCIRPDGSAYGTGGKCRKGTEGEAKAKGKSESSQALGKVKIVSPDTAKKMSDAELKSQVENANKAAFGKGSKVSPEVMKGLKEQHDIASNELASRTKSKESGEQSKVTATPGMAARVKAAKEKLKADKAANGGKRPDRIQEERRLEQNRKQREMDRKVKANQKKQEEMLRQPAKKPEQSVADKAMEMVKANARARGMTEIKAGGSKPAAPASTAKKPAVQGYDWRKQSGTFRKADND